MAWLSMYHNGPSISYNIRKVTDHVPIFVIQTDMNLDKKKVIRIVNNFKILK